MKDKQAKPCTDLTTQRAVEQLMDEGGGAAVIDFWAPWCAPCRAMAPAFEAVAQRFSGEPVRFFKLDTEAHPELAAPFHVRSIPTLLFVNQGEVVDVVVGALSAERLAQKVDWLLSKARGEGFFDRLLGRGKPQPAGG